MNAIKPSVESEKAKNEFINVFIETSKKPTVNSAEHIIIVRGERSMLLKGDIVDIVEDYKTSAYFTKAIKASEECKASHHQIDFIMFTKISEFEKKEMSSEDVPLEYKGIKGMKAMNDKLFEESKENAYKNKAVIFFIMSRENLEMRTYDIIEAINKKGEVTDRVISSNPQITTCVNSIDPNEKKGALIILAGNPIPNFFDEEIAKIFNENITIDQNEIDELFKHDYKLFKEKSDFIKERDEKISSNQE